MATYGFRISISPSMQGYANAARKANLNIKNNFRANLRDEGERFLDLAGQEARGGPSGRIAKGMFYRTYQRSDVAELRVYPGLIGSYHLYGTGIYSTHPDAKRERIKPTGGRRAMVWEGEGGKVFAASVAGIRPDPFFSRAYRRWLPGARAMLRTVSELWVRELATAKESIKNVGV